MGKHEQAGDEVDRLGGKAKEVLGDVTDDRELEAEGHKQQAGAEFRQAADKAKEAVKDALER
jgi:uncharacterized protein YjbJ (UPF0337 family)